MSVDSRVFLMIGLELDRKEAMEFEYIEGEDYEGTDLNRTKKLQQLMKNYGMELVPVDMDYNQYVLGAVMAKSESDKWAAIDVAGKWYPGREVSDIDTTVRLGFGAFERLFRGTPICSRLWVLSPQLILFTQTS